MQMGLTATPALREQPDLLLLSVTTMGEEKPRMCHSCLKKRKSVTSFSVFSYKEVNKTGRHLSSP